MKKFLIALTVSIVSLNSFATSISAESESESIDFYVIEMDLNNKEEQTMIYSDEDGNKHTVTMSADMSVSPYVDITVPYGAFTRSVSDTNDLMTMKCRIKGTSNPYTASTRLRIMLKNKKSTIC